MELTLDQALQKGVEAHKAGKVQEADQYYTAILKAQPKHCLLYTSPSPRDAHESRMPSSA